MSTITLNRNLDSYDFLLVSLNDRACEDLMDSRKEESMNRWHVVNEQSLSEKIKRFFLGK